MKRRTKHRPFVALDGEASGDNYALLAASSGQTLFNRQGLSTEDCLDFLLALPRGSTSGIKPIYTWFAMDYDVNMILGDLELKGEAGTIQELREKNETVWRGYHIAYLRRKIFRVSRGKKRFVSYDVWSFFAKTFEGSLQDWKIPVPEIITEGKQARGSFARWGKQKLIEYNQAELEQLTELCEQLREAIKPLDLSINSWHGPGALANSWLRKNKAQEWLPVDPLPEGLEDAARRAYFGGRIDTQGYGIVNPVYHYDIVSAYPSAIRHLPDLSQIEWARGMDTPAREGFSVARIRWNIPETKWGPFPWRGRDGIIRFPQEGEGWYWFPEIQTALDRFPNGTFDFIEYYEAKPKAQEIEYPFHSLIEEAFHYRNELKKKGHPSNVAVKLILNSLYGKFAQTVGKARYYSPIWAGLITSHTRAQLASVLSDDVVCVMTDSVWSRAPLPIADSSQLGGWERGEENRLVLAEAGLYKATTPDGKENIWQRGFDKRTPVDIEGVVKTWLYDDPAFAPSYRVHRFIGMGLASMSSHPWRQWVDLDRTIHPVPLAGTTKRLPLYPLQEDDVLPEGDFISLALRPRDRDEISAPYIKLTVDNSLIVQRLEEECSDE